MVLTLAPSFAAQPPPAFLLTPLPSLTRPPTSFGSLPPSLLAPFVSPPAPWHAIIVRYGHEIPVTDRIATALDLEAYCPTFEASWVHRGRSRSQVYPYLRSYVFARWDAFDAHLWHALHDLTGVLGFAGGALPAPIPEREIALLREKVASYRPHPTRANRPRPALGSRVRVTDGPFVGHEGRVARSPAAPPVVAVEISGLLSRDVVVEVLLDCCELIVQEDHSATPGPGTAQQRKRGRRGGTSRVIESYAFRRRVRGPS